MNHQTETTNDNDVENETTTDVERRRMLGAEYSAVNHEDDCPAVRIRVLDDNSDDAASFVTAAQSVSSPRQWYHQPLLCSDEAIEFRGVRLVDGPEAIRLAKFVGITFAGIWTWYYSVRWLVSALY